MLFPLDFFMGLGGTEYWYHLCMNMERGNGVRWVTVHRTEHWDAWWPVCRFLYFSVLPRWRNNSSTTSESWLPRRVIWGDSAEGTEASYL